VEGLTDVLYQEISLYSYAEDKYLIEPETRYYEAEVWTHVLDTTPIDKMEYLFKIMRKYVAKSGFTLSNTTTWSEYPGEWSPESEVAKKAEQELDTLSFISKIQKFYSSPYGSGQYGDISGIISFISNNIKFSSMRFTWNEGGSDLIKELYYDNTMVYYYHNAFGTTGEIEEYWIDDTFKSIEIIIPSDNEELTQWIKENTYTNKFSLVRKNILTNKIERVAKNVNDYIDKTLEIGVPYEYYYKENGITTKELICIDYDHMVLCTKDKSLRI